MDSRSRRRQWPRPSPRSQQFPSAVRRTLSVTPKAQPAPVVLPVDAVNGVLVHLGGSLKDLVLGSALLIALDEMGFVVDLLLDTEAPGAAQLYTGWSVVRSVSVARVPAPLSGYAQVIPAIAPPAWPRFSHWYANCANGVPRPPDAEYERDPRSYYLAFARGLGPEQPNPFPRLPIAPVEAFGAAPLGAVVLLPERDRGAGSGWPHFAELAARLRDPIVLGAGEELRQFRFSRTARVFDALPIRSAAELLAGAGCVVGNDNGLSALAIATGTPTLVIGSPAGAEVLGNPPPHAMFLTAGVAVDEVAAAVASIRPDRRLPVASGCGE